jgi:hypothetical protein
MSQTDAYLYCLDLFIFSLIILYKSTNIELSTRVFYIFLIFNGKIHQVKIRELATV